ncbi:MAG TPA: SurA N-terminal domain-containing protein, partial [Flavobacteriales bacterium]|nr:SurA N-terminal domain-containing protein [Flavobacteriales bacterium]
MAIIGRIRSKGGLLVGIVGLAMALFIIGALWDNPGRGRRDETLGSVGDQEISASEFEGRVDDELESYRRDFNQQVTGQ